MFCGQFNDGNEFHSMEARLLGLRFSFILWVMSLGL